MTRFSDSDALSLSRTVTLLSQERSFVFRRIQTLNHLCARTKSARRREKWYGLHHLVCVYHTRLCTLESATLRALSLVRANKPARKALNKCLRKLIRAQEAYYTAVEGGVVW